MADPFAFSGIPGATAGTAAPQAAPYQQPPPPQQQQQQQQQQQYQQQHYQQPAPQAFGAQPPRQQQQQQQLVVAAQPSNPYAGMVAPQPPQQHQHQHSPWDAAPVNVNPNSSFVAPPPARASTASAASFDPFAAFSAPALAPPPQQQQAYPTAAAPAPAVQDPWAAAATQDPWAAAAGPLSQEGSAPPQQQPYPAPAPPQQQQQRYSQPQAYQTQQDQTQKSAYSHQSYGNNNNNNISRQMVPAPPSSVVVRENGGNRQIVDAERFKDPNAHNPYSKVLAQQVSGSNCSGLPKAELVGKRGFVLSRISFRTIVMKKWKQSFWVQYGGHTMLWFRTKGDFDDWLNNPYHTQTQRNFLIKLAINFVHDLYKPNVRGYQVTQCRTKPYGKSKVVRQFKLERWMDYGPTIAAAFGSYDPKEVDACREAIVECMKNTPLDNGIRATGAVKEHHDRKQEQEWQKSQEERQLHPHPPTKAGPPQTGGGGGRGGYQNYTLTGGANGTADPGRRQSMQNAPSFDLLGDDSNAGAVTDDSASVPPSFFGHAGAGAIIPAVNPTAAYPGAPPAPPSYYPSAAQPQMQQQPPQQAYPNPPQASQPSPYGAAPVAAPAPQGYPGQQQQYQQQALAPAFAQQQAPAFAQQQAPAFAQQPSGGHPQQQQQPGAYSGASYPVPKQQY